MQNKQKNIESDRDFDRKMRYYELNLALWKIEDELRKEYPEEMWYSRKRLAEKLLSVGLIKCKHEK